MAVCSGRVAASAGWYDGPNGKRGLVQAINHRQLAERAPLHGFVMVCRRSDFVHWGGREWRAASPVVPVRLVEVSDRELAQPLLEVTADARQFTDDELRMQLGDPFRYSVRGWGSAKRRSGALRL